MTGLTAAGTMAATLTQAIAGDEAAFARIVAAYHADMVRVAYGICGEREASLDAVQAAWVIAWRKLRAIREPEHLRGWLVAVAANEARHVARRRRSTTVIEIARIRHLGHPLAERRQHLGGGSGADCGVLRRSVARVENLACPVRWR